MIATPHMKDQMILIMKRDYYKTVQMASFFKKMRIRWDFILIITFESQIRRLRTINLKILISVDMAGTVDPETLRRCISLWVMYYLTPKFCIVDLNSFVLTDAGKLSQYRGFGIRSNLINFKMEFSRQEQASIDLEYFWI